MWIDRCNRPATASACPDLAHNKFKPLFHAFQKVRAAAAAAAHLPSVKLGNGAVIFLQLLLLLLFGRPARRRAVSSSKLN